MREHQHSFIVGGFVHLNSGSPPLEVICLDGASVTVAWDGSDGSSSLTAPQACFYAASPEVSARVPA